MYTHLKDHQYYEDIYDRYTVEICRKNEQMLLDVFLAGVEEVLPELAENALTKEGRGPIEELARVHHTFHYFYIAYNAGERWEEREKTIAEWMSRDEGKDLQLQNARLTTEPVCQHCSKTGLRIISKDLMHRGDDYKWDGPEEVLIMLSCMHCNKNSAYWEDGSPWERIHTYCPKCKATMEEKTTTRGKVLTTVYSCLACGHSYSDTLDLRRKPKPKEKPDPDYEKDKLRFCYNEEQGKEFLKQKQNVLEMQRIVKGWQEKRDNQETYDAISAIDKVTIPQLSERIRPAIEKAGYTEFSLDKPEMGKDVCIGFNCLDSKSGCGDYDSRTALKKTVEKALADTNWRLMSDGIHYRLGYLNGRLRAYEREEDLKSLVQRSTKSEKKRKPDTSVADPSKSFRTSDGKEVIF